MKNCIVFFLLLFPILFYGQKLGHLTGSLESNSQWYVDDKNIGGFNEEDSFRSNNYLKFNYYIKNITAEIKFESYAPQALLNFSPNLNKSFGIATFAIKYQLNKIDLTLGNFYNQYGSGLLFRSFEDRHLGIDNSIRGFRFQYQPENLFLTGFAGKQRVGFNLSDGFLFGFNSEIDLTSFLNKRIGLGFSYVGRNQKLADPVSSNIDNTTNMFSGRINYSNNDFYSNIEYVYKGDDALVEFGSIIDDRIFDGNALILNLGYTKKGLGLDATFRRTENMAIYSDREAYGNIYNDQITNYIPSLTKQHHFSLSNIYVYQSQPQLTFIPFGKSGEIGTQIDLFYKVKKNSFLGGKYGTLLTINYAQWSRLKAVYDLSNRTYESEFLKFGDKNFSDFNIEINKKWSANTTSIFTFINLFYDKEYLEEKVGQINASIVAAEIDYNFNEKRSTRIQLEHLWTKNDNKNWAAISLEYNFSEKLTIYANDLYNYGNDINNDKIHYYNLGSNYNFGTTRLTLNYGRQRGGLVCIGGICRFVPNSTGLSISLNSYF